MIIKCECGRLNNTKRRKNSRDCSKKIVETGFYKYKNHVEDFDAKKCGPIKTMSPSEICRKHNIQNCHFCDDINCCDNKSPLKQRLDEILEEVVIEKTIESEEEMPKEVEILEMARKDGLSAWHCRLKTMEVLGYAYIYLHYSKNSNVDFNGQREKLYFHMREFEVMDKENSDSLFYWANFYYEVKEEFENLL